MRNNAASAPVQEGRSAAPVDSIESEQLLAAFHRAPNVGLAVCDAKLRYLSINAALAAMNGVPIEAHFGKTLRDILGTGAGKIEANFKRVFRTGVPVLDAEVSAKLPGRKELGSWIESYFPLQDKTGKVRQVAVLVVEITTEKKLKESIRSLNGKLLRLRDFEQRRIARELHDSVNQYHAALKMNLGRLARCENPRARSKLLSQSVELLKNCIVETRSICHLLHPPLLDLAGLGAAIRQYVRGFAERSAIHVRLTISPKFGRLPEDIELTVYRVLQESLTNVYRHAKTSLVRIQLTRKNGFMHLEVRDYGRGIRPGRLQRLQSLEASQGVGLSSIRERIDDLGGRFEIRSGKAGTLVSVAVPVPEPRLTLRHTNPVSPFTARPSVAPSSPKC